MNECCILRVEDHASQTEFDGVVADVSVTGMRVLLDLPVPATTSVTVILASQLLTASVVYCGKERGAFSLGLRIEAASEELRSLCRQGLAVLPHNPDPVESKCHDRLPPPTTDPRLP